MRQIQLHPQADDRTKLYNVEFYHEQSGGSFESAQVKFPILTFSIVEAETKNVSIHQCKPRA